MNYRITLIVAALCVMTANIEKSSAQAPTTNRTEVKGLWLGMSLQELRNKIGDEYHFGDAQIVAAPYKIEVVNKGDCSIYITLEDNVSEDDQRRLLNLLNANPEAKRLNSSYMQWDDTIAPLLLQRKIESFSFPMCFFGASGMNPKDFAQQLLDAYPFVTGKIYLGPAIGEECITCWIGLLPTGETLRVESKFIRELNESYTHVIFEKASYSLKNAISPPKIDFHSSSDSSFRQNLSESTSSSLLGTWYPDEEGSASCTNKESNRLIYKEKVLIGADVPQDECKIVRIGDSQSADIDSKKYTIKAVTVSCISSDDGAYHDSTDIIGFNNSELIRLTRLIGHSGNLTRLHYHRCN